jgi:hypothetical protein
VIYRRLTSNKFQQINQSHSLDSKNTKELNNIPHKLTKFHQDHHIRIKEEIIEDILLALNKKEGRKSMIITTRRNMIITVIIVDMMTSINHLTISLIAEVLVQTIAQATQVAVDQVEVVEIEEREDIVKIRSTTDIIRVIIVAVGSRTQRIRG